MISFNRSFTAIGLNARNSDLQVFMVDLLCAHPQFRPLYEEHISDYDEMLSHLLIADVERWVEDPGQDQELVQKLLDWLDFRYSRSSAIVQELVSVSFLEHLPYAGQPGVEIAERLGPTLTAELHALRRSS